MSKATFPPQIKYIVGNEACERFSYYGMRAILVVFMTKHLQLAAQDATSVYHLFASACYLLPLLGSFLSDRYLGKYKTIMLLSIVYCLGHLTLAIFETEQGLYWGLGLIALGAGGIKPCVSAHVGDQFNETNSHLLQKVFDLFYFAINFGAFFSSLLTPIVLVKYGPSWAFGIPGILMAIATFWFWMGRKHYVHVPPTGRDTAGFMPIFFYSLMNLGKKKAGQEFFDVALDKYSKEEVEGAKAAAGIFKVFITVSVFWALFDQNGSTWVLQAEKMDLNVFGTRLEASQIQALNPILVMLLVPIFSFGIYPAVEKFLGIKMTPLRKMSAGMVLAAASFAIVALIQRWIDAGQTPSIAWQIPAYVILTCSEVMVSITGLEFAYTQAPRAMKSTIMSFWLLTVFVGNMLTAYIAKVNVFQGAAQFDFFTALMFAVSLVFVFAASRYKVRNFVEKAEVTPMGEEAIGHPQSPLTGGAPTPSPGV